MPTGLGPLKYWLEALIFVINRKLINASRSEFKDPTSTEKCLGVCLSLRVYTDLWPSHPSGSARQAKLITSAISCTSRGPPHLPNCIGRNYCGGRTGWAHVGEGSGDGVPGLAVTSISILASNKENGTSMVKPLEYLTYRGGPGHWSWVLHRLSGIGVFLFLLIHIVDISVIGWGPTVFNKLLFLYRNPVFRVGEVGLVAAVLYHAINGVRICITTLAGNHGVPSQAQLCGGEFTYHHSVHFHGRV